MPRARARAPGPRGQAFQQEITNAARALAAKIGALHAGGCVAVEWLTEPRPK